MVDVSALAAAALFSLVASLQSVHGRERTRKCGEAVAAIFYTLPLIVILAAVPWLHRYLRPRATPARLVAFGLFGVVTAFGLMRSPYDVRAVDDVTIPAILFGCCVAALWRTALPGVACCVWSWRWRR